MASLADYAPDERTARVILSLVIEPADETVGRLLHQVGGIETLRLLASDTALPDTLPDEVAILRHRVQLVSSGVSFADVIRDAIDGRFFPLIPGDDHWPAAVNELGDRAPYVLWAKGATSFLSGALRDRVTITGARAATSYGNLVAGELANEVSMAEQIVVAGGAYGIEGAVHRSVLSGGGHTIAVLPSGLDRLYPQGHRELLEHVGDLGLLLSEMPPGSTPTKGRFIARSRLLAALSSATVIVEAGSRSGTMEVARQAQALGRRVGAVPGPITSAASYGPHRLLREGTASMVTNADDLSKLMDDSRPATASQERSQRPHVGMASEEPDIDRDRPDRTL